MFWEYRSAYEGMRDEYRGWQKFKQAAGVWPIYSVIAGVLSIPAFMTLGIYIFILAAKTWKLPLIYTVLFVTTISGAASGMDFDGWHAKPTLPEQKQLWRRLPRG